jgi:hypothetical protein
MAEKGRQLGVCISAIAKAIREKEGGRLRCQFPTTSPSMNFIFSGTSKGTTGLEEAVAARSEGRGEIKEKLGGRCAACLTPQQAAQGCGGEGLGRCGGVDVARGG